MERVDKRTWWQVPDLSCTKLPSIWFGKKKKQFIIVFESIVLLLDGFFMAELFLICIGLY